MDIITQRFDDHLDTHTKMRNYIEEIRVVADICKNALDKGHKILFCGNGDQLLMLNIWQLNW